MYKKDRKKKHSMAPQKCWVYLFKTSTVVFIKKKQFATVCNKFCNNTFSSELTWVSQDMMMLQKVEEKVPLPFFNDYFFLLLK